MTQEQYDDLVKSVGQSVIETLTEKGLVAKTPAPDSPPTPSEAASEDSTVDQIAAVLHKVPATIDGFSAVWANLAQLADRLDRTASGGRGASAFLSLVVLVAAAGFLVEFAVGRLTAPARRGVAQQFATRGGLWRLAWLWFIDAFAFSALLVTVHLARGTLFAAADAQTQFAAIVLPGFVAWRFYLLLARIFLRPKFPEARVAPVGDRSAVKLFWLFSALALIAIIARSLTALQVTPEAIFAVVLANSVIVPALYTLIILYARGDISDWLLRLIDENAGRSSFKAMLARHWHWIAIPVIVIIGGARAYEALSGRDVVPTGSILTVNVFVGLLLVETLLSFAVKRHDASVLAGSDKPEAHRLLPFAVRTLRTTILVVAAAVLVRVWAVDVLALVDQRSWANFSHGWTTGIITVLFAYFAWEGVRFATVHHGARSPAKAPGQDGDPEIGQATASRLETLAPILRVALGVTIVIVAALMILSNLNVNITPIVAGASVFGLAISFGSQTLVRDIVSGVFYLADDAFRVGEYIDCGKAKGTVEGFTLRSIRLRHQNGQIHTIPFGQLGQITNFSRDWSTLKFNLRFVRDTDLEKLRKVTKKVGEAMLEDPELKDDFLEPLKLQGVADIADNAIIMRFKMTVRPVRPTFVQRQGVKRLIAAFKEAGVEFATATVNVQTVGGNSVGIAAAAAAASASGNTAVEKTD
jgi:small-conductance mechanosensitive channel